MNSAPSMPTPLFATKQGLCEPCLVSIKADNKGIVQTSGKPVEIPIVDGSTTSVVPSKTTSAPLLRTSTTVVVGTTSASTTAPTTTTTVAPLSTTIGSIPTTTATNNPSCNSKSMQELVCDAAGQFNRVALINGAFDEQVGNPFFPSPTSDFKFVPSNPGVTGCETTDSSGDFEVWSNDYNCVPADSLPYFVELNAHEASTLYQDVYAAPGEMIKWSLKHRGRSGDDTMEVLVSPCSRYVNGTGRVWCNFQSQGIFTDGNSAWGLHGADYVVPPAPLGQTYDPLIRFAFRAVSSAGGDKSYGNFLDSITFKPVMLVCSSTHDVAAGTTYVFNPLDQTATTTGGSGSVTASLIEPAEGTLDVAPNGTISFAPSNVTYTGPQQINYTVTDTSAGCSTSAVLTLNYY